MVRYTFYDNSPGENSPDPGAADFYRKKAESLKKEGIGSLMILTYDTYPGRPDPNAPDDAYNDYIGKFARRSGQIAKLLADLKPAFQVWNEPDHPVHPGYVPTLSETVYARMQKRTYEAVKAVDPKMLVVTGGLSQGNPSWLSRVIQKAGGTLHADAVGVHPYGQRPEPNWPDPNWAFGYVGNLINGYYNAGKRKPLWITEMGIKEADLGGDRAQCAEFMKKYYHTIAGKYANKVHELMWFCYSDGMVPTFGLKDENLNPKPIYHAFKEAVVERPPPPPPPAPKPVAKPKPAPKPVPKPVTKPAPVAVPQPLPATPAPVPVVAPPAPVAPDPQVSQLKIENATLKQQLWRLQQKVNELEDQVKQAPPEAVPAVAPVPSAVPLVEPPMQNITQQLKKNPNQRFPERPLNQIQRVIIHYTGISPQVGADRIAAHRVDKQGWPGIGYHFFITGTGQIQQTNELTTVASHAGQFNQSSIAICFAGNFDSASPSPAQMESGAQLTAWLVKQLNLQPTAVLGHKDLVPNQASPGLQWNSGAMWGNQFRAKVQAKM